MPIPKKASLLAFAPWLLAAQAPPASPPASSAGIYPLSQVHAGLHGTAYTVFQGMEPEPFGVDILGVMPNAQGPGEAMILARLTGVKAEYTGVVAGMSGSPVYIDGKLVGALAFRIGEFSKEPIAGITPIAQMLPVRDMDGSAGEPEATNTAAAAVPGGVMTGGMTGAMSGGTTGAAIQPIDTPLVFSGFSPAALALWKQQAPSLGMEPQFGLGGGAETRSAPPLEPGSAVSALLVAGDMEIAATCTVTYLDSNRLLACGHPLTQFGAVSLPMTKADVLATLPSPAGSFKIVNTGETVGAFTEDRQTAIGGMVGGTAHMIPCTIVIHTGGKERAIHLRVLDQAQLTPTAILVSLFQALQETPGYQEEASYRVSASVALPPYAPVAIHTLATPGGAAAANLLAALTVGTRFNTLYSSSDRRTPIQKIQIDVDVLDGRHAATLSRATVEQTLVHAGDAITVGAVLLPYRGATRSLRIPLKLPASLPSGDVRLLVSDGPTLDRLLAAGRSAGPVPLASTVAELNGLHPDDRLYVTLLRPDAELSVDGRVLPSLPLSVANLLAPGHERDRASLHSESADTLASVPLDASLSGEQVLTLRVE